jgi:hypothetical protein
VPSDPSRPNRWWIAPVLGVVVVATAAAALVVQGVYQQQPANSAPVVVSTGSSSVPRGAEPGSSVVSVTPDVVKFAQHTEVQQLFQAYFDAINTKQYDKWRSVVTSDLADEEPRALFLNGYRSTRDGSIVVYRVDNAPDRGLRVLLTFHSVQAVADAPAKFPYGCVAWQVVSPLSWDTQQKGWKIDAGVTGASPQGNAC